MNTTSKSQVNILFVIKQTIAVTLDINIIMQRNNIK